MYRHSPNSYLRCIDHYEKWSRDRWIFTMGNTIAGQAVLWSVDLWTPFAITMFYLTTFPPVASVALRGSCFVTAPAWSNSGRFGSNPSQTGDTKTRQEGTLSIFFGTLCADLLLQTQKSTHELRVRCHMTQNQRRHPTITRINTDLSLIIIRWYRC